MSEPVFAINAAKYFLEKNPRYIVCRENSGTFTAEIVRLLGEGACLAASEAMNADSD
jgi:hypothetical protein